MSDEEIRIQEAEPSPEQAVLTVAQLRNAVEAILFAAGYPVRYDRLAEVLGLTENDIKLLVGQMAPLYNDETSSRGLRLLMLPETCQLCTKEEFLPYIREALGIRRGGNLSASSLEVIAVVAYNQPVTRAFIDQVRGVDSSYAVNSLIDKGLIESCGRLDAPGRPMLYATTDKFLRVFGFNSLDDLPETEPLVDNTEKDESSEPDGEKPVERSEPLPVAAETEPNDDDVKIAQGRIEAVGPGIPEIDLGSSDFDETAGETGGEIENSAG